MTGSMPPSSDPLLVQAIKHLTEQVGQQRADQQEQTAQLRADQQAQFSSLNNRLDRLVTHETFSREQARVDDKIRANAEDIADVERRLAERIADEKAAREKAITEENAGREKAITAEATARIGGDAAQQTLLDKLGGNIKWVAVSVLLPVALFLANFFSNRGA